MFHNKSFDVGSGRGVRIRFKQMMIDELIFKFRIKTENKIVKNNHRIQNTHTGSRGSHELTGGSWGITRAHAAGSRGVRERLDRKTL